MSESSSLTTQNPALYRSEIERRRTFAIISHPDAGKTTLTEKLLLYGGAIQMAGAVHAKKNRRQATSDWMELEKTARHFNYLHRFAISVQGHVLNLLDTPGHQDFSEDTYRTLVAADAALMLIDNAKGVEPQTKKLFHVCRQRGIPIFTFVNKMDRPGKDPLELMEELEEVLGIRSVPVVWPVGDGDRFKAFMTGRRSNCTCSRGPKAVSPAPPSARPIYLTRSWKTSSARRCWRNCAKTSSCLISRANRWTRR